MRGKIMQHMTLDPRQKISETESENRLYNALGVYGRSQIEKLKEYKEKIKDMEKLVIYPDDPNMGQLQSEYF